MAHHAGLYRRRQYWYFKYKDENGKWIEHATRTIDRKKALSIKTGFLRELETGQLPNDRSQWTFGKAAGAWLLDRKLRVARSSYFSEKAIVGSLERHLGTETKLTKLANIHSINQYQTARLKEGLSPKTVNNEVLALGSILREARVRVESEQKTPFYLVNSGTYGAASNTLAVFISRIHLGSIRADSSTVRTTLWLRHSGFRNRTPPISTPPASATLASIEGTGGY
jgi:hypothetical protein